MLPFIKKLLVSLIAGFSSVSLLLVFGNSGTISWLPPILIFSLCGILLLAALILPFIWQYSTRENFTERIEGFLNQIIVYTLASNIATFGWKKIFGLQFLVPSDIAAKPINQLSGEWLTWFYFGFSKPYGLLLACIQIIGAYLLLFRKTMLPASLILLAFMFNLSLINLFYGLNLGALLQSIIISIGLCYLLGLHYQSILVFLKTSTQISGTENQKLSAFYRLIVIIISLTFVLFLKSMT